MRVGVEALAEAHGIVVRRDFGRHGGQVDVQWQ